MDITIYEFDKNENTVRTVNYYDVELIAGKTYSMNANDETFKPYELSNKADNLTVDYDYDSMQTETTHTIKVISGILHQGEEIYTQTTASKLKIRTK